MILGSRTRRSRGLICLIALGARGGVLTAVKHMSLIFEELGFKSIIIDNRSLLSRNCLSLCDVVHVNGFLSILDTAKILIYAREKTKIITLHGWVIDEAKLYLFVSEENVFKRVMRFLFTYVNWLIHKLIVIPLFYDLVTSVSDITARKNKIKSIVIRNPLVPALVNEKINKCDISINKKQDEIIGVTYVSIGGNKILSIPRLVKLILKVNASLKNMGSNKRVKLYIFGKDLPKRLVKIISNTPCIKYVGFSDCFLSYLKQADIMVLGYTMPELGYAVLEAAYLGIPIAKFTEDPDEEELVNQINAIIAREEKEMIEKLVYFVTNIDKLKPMLGNNIRDHILKTHLKQIKFQWRLILENVLEKGSHKRKVSVFDDRRKAIYLFVV